MPKDFPAIELPKQIAGKAIAVLDADIPDRIVQTPKDMIRRA